jgi:sec-independent protein translocase protein TatA
MRMPQGAEWLILLLIVVLLFGAKRLPDAARGLGRSMRIFKAETKGLASDDAPETPPAAAAPVVAAPVVAPAPAPAAVENPPVVPPVPAAPAPAVTTERTEG